MAFPQVRFDDLCVLIPRESRSTPSRFPITRSHSAPLWTGKRHPGSSDSDDYDDCLLTIPCLGLRVPCLIRKTKSHHNLHHRHQQPIQSCLSRKHITDCTDPQRSSLHTPPALVHVPHRRRQSLPPCPPATVPLRDCCPDCVHSVESALSDNYCEKWSSGAVRRRHASEHPLRTMREVGCTILANNRAARRNFLQVDRTPSCSLEEDDEDLFPLPHQKRSPCASPTPSGTSTPTRSRPTPTSTPKIASTTRLLQQAEHHLLQSISPPPPPSLTGRALLAQYPDVDEIPAGMRKRSPSNSSTASSGSSAGLISRVAQTRNRSGSASTNGSSRRDRSGSISSVQDRSNNLSLFNGGVIAKSVQW